MRCRDGADNILSQEEYKFSSYTGAVAGKTIYADTGVSNGNLNEIF